MKKTLALLLVLVMAIGLFAGCGASNAGGEVKVAMITDYGDITDQSFNQTTYEACKAFCEANKIPFDYKKPAADSTADRVAMVDAAVNDGYNVIVMPGFAFAGTVQAYVPTDMAAEYKTYMEAVFGEGAVYVLNVRPEGAIKLM